MGYKAGPGASAEAGYKAAKSTTNGTVNLGTDNNNGDAFNAATGDMAVRAGQSVATVNATALANEGVAYWIVTSSKVLATDVIVATCPRDWFPVTVYGLVAGSFRVSVTNNSGSEVAVGTSDANKLVLNWVAL